MTTAAAPASIPCPSTGTASGSQLTCSSGNTATVTDEAGVERTNTYDGLGRLKQVVENGIGSAVTSYTYDVQGNLTGVTQNGGAQTRSFGYDSLGRLSTAANPESGTTCYGLLSGATCVGSISGVAVGYDGNGNLLNRTDGRGIVTTMTYDALNRLTGKTYSDFGGANPTPWVTYLYQGTTDFLSSEFSNASGYSWSNYDALGRPGAGTQTTAGQPYAFSSVVWTPTGQIASITYPSGRVVKTSFDAAGRISGVGLNGNPTAYAGSTSYAAHGGLISMAMGDGLTRTFGYNRRLQTGSVGAGSLLNLGLNWNANGTLGSQTIGRPGGFSATQSYNYDGVNRLTYVAESNGVQNWNQTYIYDNVGNRAVAASGTSGLAGPSNYTPQTTLTASPPPGSTTNWPYNPATNQWAAPAATHDVAGNMTALRTQTMTFDAESRMIGWSDSSPSASVAVAYDGDGRRVTKVSTAGTTVTTTTYVYDPAGNLAAEYGGSAPTTQTLYLTQDHLGSTRLVTTTGGVCVGAHDYLPFGEEIPQSLWGRGSVPCYGQTDTAMKFTGQERDNETAPGGSGQNGLDNYLARFMASGQGRFLSPDPAGNFVADLTNPQSWNMYSYALNNPLTFVDPSGLDPCPPGSTADTCVTVTDSPPGVGTVTVAPGQCVAVYVEGQPNGSYCNTGGSPTQIAQQPQPAQPSKQTFLQCMATHANDASLAGFIDAVDGGRTNLRNNQWANIFLGNDITTLAFGSGGEAAAVGATKVPWAAVKGAGSPLTYGRRTTDILSLNLSVPGVRAPGGVPLALGDASIAAKGALRFADKALGLFTFSVEAKFAVDLTLTAAEAGFCIAQTR